MAHPLQSDLIKVQSTSSLHSVGSYRVADNWFELPLELDSIKFKKLMLLILDIK